MCVWEREREREYQGFKKRRRKGPEIGERLEWRKEEQNICNCHTGYGERMVRPFLSLSSPCFSTPVPAKPPLLALGYTVRYPWPEQSWISDWWSYRWLIDEAEVSCDKSVLSNQGSVFPRITLPFNNFIKAGILLSTTEIFKNNQHFSVAPLCPGPSEVMECNDFFQDNNYKTLSCISKWLYILFKY